MRYQFVQHNWSGEIWAARIDDAGRVVGIFGPLLRNEVSNSLLPEYEYRTNPKELADFNENPDDFSWEMLADTAVSD